MSSSAVDQGKESILQFAPFQSAVDEGFWHRLSSLKLNKLGIDESPIPITGMLSRITCDFEAFLEFLCDFRTSKLHGDLIGRL